MGWGSELGLNSGTAGVQGLTEHLLCTWQEAGGSFQPGPISWKIQIK